MEDGMREMVKGGREGSGDRVADKGWGKRDGQASGDAGQQAIGRRGWWVQPSMAHRRDELRGSRVRMQLRVSAGLGRSPQEARRRGLAAATPTPVSAPSSHPPRTCAPRRH